MMKSLGKKLEGYITNLADVQTRFVRIAEKRKELMSKSVDASKLIDEQKMSRLKQEIDASSKLISNMQVKLTSASAKNQR